MLISNAPDEDGDVIDECTSPEDHSHEYETATELFELMAQNPNITSNDGGTLTQRDLVLLYKNIDLSAQLISNRRVENIVYGGDPESDSSDVSEVHSNEDLQNIILINKEQIDFLSSPSSVENKLCHKLGGLEIQSSVDNDYDKYFLFKDPYIKEQLKNFNLFSTCNEEASVLPASLLDYVCCKRLEDNYNFYMDNIIRYVKNTIEQLRRISNGDYLTDRAKQKWREVDNPEHASHNNTKVLATSTSIPLHVECKIDGLRSTWDDLVHSAVDVRSLSKILEKKIIVEIPKLIKGSFTLLSKCYADNLIISCKEDYQRVEDNKNARVDVVLQLKRSETGQVVSNISSVMILKSTPAVPLLPDTIDAVGPLPLVYRAIDEVTTNLETQKDARIIELDSINDIHENSFVDAEEGNDEDSDSFGCRYSENHNTSYIYNSSSQDDMTGSSTTLNTDQDTVKKPIQKEASFDMCPDDLRITIQRLAAQSALPEETVEEVSQSTVMKRKSPTRVRIKSPYENKSYILEEKKRKKLLEIRERRERKKMAMAESCKISKHRYGKATVMPQASSSVTKLSITNKSFYNSIYGHVDTKMDVKQSNSKSRKKVLSKEDLQDAVETPQGETTLSPSNNNKKIINRSYYLDDTVTEMMYLKMKGQDQDVMSASNSGVSSDFRNNFNMFSPLIAEFERNYNDLDEKAPADTHKHLFIGPSDSESNQESNQKELSVSQSTHNIVPVNTPKAVNISGNNKDDLKKVMPAVECRKSIDKIYQLVKKLGKNQTSRNKPQSIFSTNTNTAMHENRGSFFMQSNDSGTSLKANVTPLNPSSFNVSKNNNTEVCNVVDKKPTSPTTVTKVVITSKSQIPILKSDSSKNKDRRRFSPTNKVQENNNPLKAISQLLHEFDNVQRKRLKSGTDPKPAKRGDASYDVKNATYQDKYKKRPHLEHHNNYVDKYSNRVSSTKEKRNKPIVGIDGLKNPHLQGPVDDKSEDKYGKKKIMEMLDEAKEARGEAIRGPSKFNSRLNSLAQPKKAYVQAHSEEYQTRYGRNLITDRLQRLASAPSPLVSDKGGRMAYARNKMKLSVNEPDYTVPVKRPVSPGLPIERPARQKYSNINSPVSKDKSPTRSGQTYKQVPGEKPEALKNKMVAVESYVKSHYGRSSREPSIAHKSRVPLFPHDIDIALAPSSTLIEATEAGSNLHRIIESMMNTTATHGLGVVTECQESNSSRDITDDVFKSSRCEEGNSIDSDYTSGSTDDSIFNPFSKNNIDKNNNIDAKQVNTNIEKTDWKKCPVESGTIIQTPTKLPLCSHMSLGTFSKRLNINNVAMSPKSSIHKLFLLQSDDGGSLVVKTQSSMSQTDTLLKLKRMPCLSQHHWNLQFPTIPMHITTVGYAFPEYNVVPAGISAPNPLDDLDDSVHKATLLCHNGLNKSFSVDESYVDRQHSENKQHYSRLEKDVQCDADVPNPTVTSIYIATPKIATYSNNGTSQCISVQAITDNEETKANSNETKITQTVTLVEKSTSDSICKVRDEVDYTSSLDILVGLLNEIQKITTCQTHITKNDADDCKELEMLLNKAAALDNSHGSSANNNVSITSLDKLRYLDSNTSIYSFYISDSEESNKRDNVTPNIDPWYETKNTAFHTTMYADKEVYVDIVDKQRVNTLTDIPSIFMPISMNHSTNMTNTFVEEFCQSSIQSVLSFTDFHTTYSNTLSVKTTHSDNYSEKTVELPRIEPVNNAKQDLDGTSQITVTIEKKKHKRNARSLVKDVSIERNILKSNTQVMPRNNYCLKSSNFDPVMKLKRDILVTVYSMLVLTVFAALSFPDVLYHVM